MSTFDITTFFARYGDRRYQRICEIDVKETDTMIFTQVRTPYSLE